MGVLPDQPSEAHIITNHKINATMSKYKELLTEENFRQWLNQFGPKQVVGTSNNTDKRPIAQFLRDMSGVKHVVVTPMGVSMGDQGNKEKFMLPPWARQYIRELDRQRYTRIHPSRALETLNNLGPLPGSRMKKDD